MPQINANLSNYEAQEAFELLPPDWYPGEAIASEIKTSAAGNQYVAWTFQIHGKPNRVWENHVLGHEVGMKNLKTFAVSAGHKTPNYIKDTEELHNKPVMLKIAIDEDEDGKYQPKNVIKGYKPIDKAAQVVPKIMTDFRPSSPPPPPVIPPEEMPAWTQPADEKLTGHKPAPAGTALEAYKETGEAPWDQKPVELAHGPEQKQRMPWE